MMLTWCATAELKKSFKLFQIYSDADTIWDDDRNSCKSTCCSCIIPFHMHNLMSSEGISRCQLQQPISSVPVLARMKFSSNGYQLQILVFFLAVCLPQQSSRCIALTEHGHFSGSSKQIHFFSLWMFISDRDGIINLQVPTSQEAADMDDNRPMALPWPFFSVLRRLNQRRPWPGVSLPISFCCIAIALTTLSTSASLVSMTA